MSTNTDKSKDQIEWEMHLEAVMKSASGKRVLSEILTMAGLDVSVYHSDRDTHLLQTGKREVALWLRDEMIEAAPGTYLKMIEEKIDER